MGDRLNSILFKEFLRKQNVKNRKNLKLRNRINNFF